MSDAFVSSRKIAEAPFASTIGEGRKIFLLVTGCLLALFAGAAFSATVAKTANTTINPSSAACPVTVGTLTLRVTTPRSSGISPFLVFYDATATTDTSIAGNATVFQDVTFTWNFGDAGTSGTSTWAYGSNAGNNSRNTATGAIAAHLYLTQGRDTKYMAVVTATDGTNTATCGVEATVYDPAGSNGFPGSATTCVSSSGTPVAGAAGCPVGASVLNSAGTTSITTALNGKRLLFKCGDTFTGGATFGGTKFSIGAYGSCVGTQTGRPVFTGANALSVGTGKMADGRLADIDFEGPGSGYAISTTTGTNNGPMTMYNLLANGYATSYYWAQGHEWALIGSVQTGESNIGTFVNYAENNCVNGSALLNCGGAPAFNDIDYQALLGNSFDGAGAPAGTSGVEVVRISACRLCVIENNTSKNANNVGAVLKLHNGNTFNSQGTWIGQYTEFVEISDNLFTGQSGSQLVEVSAQNGQVDERLRNIVVERNVFAATTGNGRQLLQSAVNATVRDNVFNGSIVNPMWGVQIAKRGVTSQGVNTPVPTAVEIYNNTCYGGAGSGGGCIGFSSTNFGTAGASSFASNNLFYSVSGGATVVDTGVGNTVSNNTGKVSANPGFIGGSGTFLSISDFKPTANFSGGTRVPVFYDALGVQWSPTWDLGAVHH